MVHYILFVIEVIFVCFYTWSKEDKQYYQNFENDVPLEEDKTGQRHPESRLMTCPLELASFRI